MQSFTYHNTTEIRFGDYIDSQLHDTVAKYGQNVLFVYGGHSIHKTGLYERVIKLLAGLNVTELPGIEPNPKIDSIRHGQQLAKANHIDVILAVGGGSVVDASKVIGSAAFYDGDPWDLVIDPAKRQHIDQLPLIDILTLAATGSEMNKGSVITNPATDQKYGTQGPNSPVVSFLDPKLTYTVPKWQTAAGSMDIFSHLCEQYFDREPDNDVTKNMIQGLMKVVLKYAPIAVKEPTNAAARTNLMWAATTTLNGLMGSGNKNRWSVHAMEHELSAYYDITHGVGLGILTPRWMHWVTSHDATTLPLFARFGREVWGISSGDEATIANEAIAKTYAWISQLGFPMTLPGVKIDSADHFAAMAKSAVNHGHLQDAYLPLSENDVQAIYHAAMTDGLE